MLLPGRWGRWLDISIGFAYGRGRSCKPTETASQLQETVLENFGVIDARKLQDASRCPSDNRNIMKESTLAASGAFEFEGQKVPFTPGQSVGAALVAASVNWLRSAEDGSPRGLACAIGVCWECRCVIDGRQNTRACMTLARSGMVVRRQEGLE